MIIAGLLDRNTEELGSLLRALNGEYVLPEAGGDLLRDGAGVLPTGAGDSSWAAVSCWCRWFINQPCAPCAPCAPSPLERIRQLAYSGASWTSAACPGMISAQKRIVAEREPCCTTAGSAQHI